MNLIISHGFPPLFTPWHFSSLEQVREDTAEILPVCQLFVRTISPKEQLCAPLTAMINVFTGR